MSSTFADRTWATLAATSVEGDLVAFDPATIGPLPAPAQRFLGSVLPPEVLLVSTIELQMTGEIKLGGRWLPFVADQILRAGVGLVWRPTVGGRIIRFTGADALGPDGASLEFRFHDRIPIVRGAGPNIARSGAGRLAAETVAWLPQALTPQAGAVWSEIDNERATVTLTAAGEEVQVEVAIDAKGNLISLGLQRWNDSAKPPGFSSFGGTVDSSYTTPNGVRVAGRGTGGWDWDSPNRSGGEFFRYTITSTHYPQLDAKPN